MNNHTNILLTAAACLLISATNVWAQDQHTYIGGQVSYIDADDRLAGRPGKVDERNAGVSGYVGFPLNPHVNLELQLFLNDINTQNGLRDDIYEIGTNADLVYQWGNREQFTPFILGGLGIVKNQMGNNTRSNHTTAYGNLGLGAVFTPMAQRNHYGIRVRGEARYAYNALSGGQNDFQVRFGLELPLGRTVERTVEVEVEKIVEKRIPVPVAEPAEPDADKDGVADMADACANTMPDTIVDKVGCAVGLKDIKRVTFQDDSNHLTPNARLLLEQAARALKGQPNIKVQIAGHTDWVGSDSYNQQLSQKRALAVRDYLIKLGIKAERIKTIGYGESKPAASNETAAGRELNRRAELVIHL